MTNHDLLLFTLGSLSGFSLAFFIFACWFSRQREVAENFTESQLADAKRVAWAAGYDAAHRNITTRINVTKK